LHAACFGTSSSVGYLFERFTIDYLKSGSAVNFRTLWSSSCDEEDEEMKIWDWGSVDVVRFSEKMNEIEEFDIDLSKTTLFVPLFDDLSGCDCLVHDDGKIYAIQISVGGKKGVGRNKIKLLDGRVKSRRKGLSHAVNAIDNCVSKYLDRIDTEESESLSLLADVKMVRNDVFVNYQSKLGLTNERLAVDSDDDKSLNEFCDESNDLAENVIGRIKNHHVALSPITPTIDYSIDKLKLDNQKKNDRMNAQADKKDGNKRRRKKKIRRFTDDEKLKAARLYQSGLSVGGVARQIGSSKTSVIRWWNELIDESEREKREK